MRYVEKNKQESGIIYAATRKDVDSLYKRLDESGHSSRTVSCWNERPGT